jgi:hypothetical protein
MSDQNVIITIAIFNWRMDLMEPHMGWGGISGLLFFGIYSLAKTFFGIATSPAPVEGLVYDLNSSICVKNDAATYRC